MIEEVTNVNINEIRRYIKHSLFISPFNKLLLNVVGEIKIKEFEQALSTLTTQHKSLFFNSITKDFFVGEHIDLTQWMQNPITYI